MTGGELHVHALNSFNRYAKLLFEQDDAPANLNVDILLHKTPDHLYGAKEIWDLYLDTKRECINVYNPLWNNKLNSDGSLPSGKDKATLLSEILDELWLEKEQERVDHLRIAAEKEQENGEEGTSAKKIKTAKMEIQPRADDWQPLAWLTFVTIGLPSEDPKTQLVTASGNGPSNVQSTVKRETQSRNNQRKLENAERADERQKNRDVNRVKLLTDLLVAVQNKRNESTPAASPVVPSPPAVSISLQLREARLAELKLYYELAEGEEKAAAKTALLNFVRDPVAYLDSQSVPAAPTPAAAEITPERLFDTPPPPPPTDVSPAPGDVTPEVNPEDGPESAKAGAKRKKMVVPPRPASTRDRHAPKSKDLLSED
eukprot:CAMPEP_0181317762 /NCGR_PEP_ID=MMETSP1101-20121128/16642_1 /TAXON_ID=46948 /ORGANISM="Rhodomonas abbreviata, Strain Caron Lab Isolate" /LENGTH=371 /DNA_ID=CAMNT_0023425179 /DNA_START=156 /DNA_END=1271 /DNA_ORIENTATION=+